MRLHCKNPTWVNSTQVEPGFTLGNFFRSVNRALGGKSEDEELARRISTFKTLTQTNFRKKLTLALKKI